MKRNEPEDWHAWEGRPFTGAWIETRSSLHDKRSQKRRPFTGAWIETWINPRHRTNGLGRPFTGAWIETIWSRHNSVLSSSPLHGGVD